MKETLYGGRGAWIMFGISHGKYEIPEEYPEGMSRELFGRSPGAQERGPG